MDTNTDFDKGKNFPTKIRDLDIEIMARMDNNTLINLCKTDKYLNSICNDDIFWMRKVLYSYNYIPNSVHLKEVNKYKSWNKYYIDDLLIFDMKNPSEDDLNDMLIKYASEGKLSLVMIVLNKGANIHYMDDNALRSAAGNDHLDVVKYLVENGANVNAGGSDSLVWASSLGNFDMVKYLISKGADIHGSNNYAVKGAINNDNLEMIKYLLSQGKNYTKNDIKNFANYAEEVNNNNIASYLKSLL